MALGLLERMSGMAKQYSHLPAVFQHMRLAGGQAELFWRVVDANGHDTQQGLPTVVRG